MFLAAPETFPSELLALGLQVEASWLKKHLSWRELIKTFSRYGLDQRKTLLGKLRTQLGLSEQWDFQYREDRALSRRFLVLNEFELHRLDQAGMCIGAHTLSHPTLSQSSPEEAWSEISRSKNDLDRALGQEIWALAYPFGDSSSVTSRELQMAKRAGYKCAFFNVGGTMGRQTPKFALPRIHITAAMSLAEFAAHISGFHRSLQELFGLANLSAALGSNA